MELLWTLLLTLFIVFGGANIVLQLLFDSPPPNFIHLHQHLAVFGNSSKGYEGKCQCDFYLDFCHDTLESLPCPKIEGSRIPSMGWMDSQVAVFKVWVWTPGITKPLCTS